MAIVSEETACLLRRYAEKYETAEFLEADPSWFMHQVAGDANREVVGFVASSLSYGSRKQFFGKIRGLMEMCDNDMYHWIRTRAFCSDIKEDDTRSFYRLYSYQTIHYLLEGLSVILNSYGTLHDFVAGRAATSSEALKALCDFFAAESPTAAIPRTTSSACKRLCMFLRWMVRDNSPVDIGIWSDFIDKKSLIMPLDTHVLTQSCRLGLLDSKTASMSNAVKLTHVMSEIFPGDPLKGDFALFGYGVNKDGR